MAAVPKVAYAGTYHAIEKIILDGAPERDYDALAAVLAEKGKTLPQGDLDLLAILACDRGCPGYGFLLVKAGARMQALSVYSMTILPDELYEFQQLRRKSLEIVKSSLYLADEMEKGRMPLWDHEEILRRPNLCAEDEAGFYGEAPALGQFKNQSTQTTCAATLGMLIALRSPGFDHPGGTIALNKKVIIVGRQGMTPAASPTSPVKKGPK